MDASVKMVNKCPGDDSEWWEVTPGERFTIRTSVAVTGGLYTMIEVTAESRNGVPVHTHANEEEHFIVLEGSIHLTNGNQSVTLSAGDSATVKRGARHAWCNLSDNPARMLIIFSPGHMEQAFRLIGSLEGGDLSAIAESAENGGSTIVGPPPFDNIYSVMSPRPSP
ncbi:quercetin dioxygenase-like cupin family protein [Rhizobium sp. BIGb0125]|jgi:quercetin dioxygenase-like cupin family protein|uniref:cupin domain-containing protein n=1 Tax=Rhizobium sp. BIGb0125 TaxID=2940618 RepID=UPI002167348E|nr:cupin domain-containing protein [Rhizobium sp. BIGb0125]MCS4244970.1 quercetin dioxygenase-like cupin family protein [Rhizobium sp. BIGb0125]